jgi:hypothetical protein
MRSWLKECKTKNMLPTQAAWLAGFFDGEGSLTFYMAGRDRQYKTWVLTLPNTNLESLKKCQEITGVGYVRPKPVKENRQPCWMWTVATQRDMISICKQMLPYLIIKKKKCALFLSEWVDV